MARPRKVKQTEEAVNPVQEASASNEFDTSIADESAQETTEKVTHKDVPHKEFFTSSEAKQAVHRVLEKKVVNAVPPARDQVRVTFRGQPRTWSSETLKVMQRSFPNDIQVNGETLKVDANGGCCG